MNSVIETMLGKYNPKNNAERENAAKEIIQEIALARWFLKENCLLWWDMP